MSGEQDDSWRTPAFRQKVLSEIDEVINASGNPAGRSSSEMENQLFQKATSKEEYLSFVARVILHMREMNDRSMSANNPHLAAALSAGNPSSNTGGEMWNSGGGVGGGQMNMLQNQLGNVGSSNAGGGGTSLLQNQLNQPMLRGPMQHQIRMTSNQMMNQGPGVSQLQTQLTQPTQLHARLSQPSQLQAQLQSGMDGGGGMGVVGGMRMTFPGQQQQQQQQQQQGMQGQNQMIGSQLQNQLSQPPRPMNVQIGPGQFTTQMGQNVTVNVRGGPMGPQGPRAGIRQPRMRMPAGMRGVQQINVMGPRVNAQNPNMSHMPRQPQQMKTEGMMGSMGPGVPASQQLNAMANSQQPMYSGAPGGPRPIMMSQVGIDKGPQVSVPVSMMSMQQQSPMQPQVSVAGATMHLQRVASPMVPSPAPLVAASPLAQQNRGFSGAPSPGGPGMSAGPGSVMRPGSAGNPEDSQYFDKIRQLSKYVEPLKKMIDKLGENDTDKMIKMKKLLDILTNPNTQVPMDTLLKCEQVLEKIVFKDLSGGQSGPGSVPPPPPATPINIPGPPSVPPADTTTGGPPSNLPSLGSVPTPGGASQPSSQPQTTTSGGGATGVPSVGAPGGATGGTGDKTAGGLHWALPPPPNLPNLMTREQQAMFGPLLDSVAASLKSPYFNHTMERTFGQCMEALFGPEIRLPERNYSPFEEDEDDESVDFDGDDSLMDVDRDHERDADGSVDEFERADIPDALRREVCGKDPEQFTFRRVPDLEFACGHITVECHLTDSKAPLVPPIVAYVPRDYPENSPPMVNPDFPGYDTSAFLESVKKDMIGRLKKLPERHTLSHILHVWEMSVRHACSIPYLNRGSGSVSKPKLIGKA